MAFRPGNIQNIHDAVARAEAAQAALKEKPNTPRFAAGSAQPGAGPNRGSREFADEVENDPIRFFGDGKTTSGFVGQLARGPGGAPMA
jgi:hypothetical protein